MITMTPLMKKKESLKSLMTLMMEIILIQRMLTRTTKASMGKRPGKEVMR